MAAGVVATREDRVGLARGRWASGLFVVFSFSWFFRLGALVWCRTLRFLTFRACGQAVSSPSLELPHVFPVGCLDESKFDNVSTFNGRPMARVPALINHHGPSHTHKKEEASLRIGGGRVRRDWIGMCNEHEVVDGHALPRGRVGGREGKPETPWARSMPLSLSLSRTHTLARKYTDLHLIIRYFPVLLLSSSLSASSSFPPSFLLLLPHSNTIQVRAFLIFTDLQV